MSVDVTEENIALLHSVSLVLLLYILVASLLTVVINGSMAVPLS